MVVILQENFSENVIYIYFLLRRQENNMVYEEQTDSVR